MKHRLLRSLPVLGALVLGVLSAGLPAVAKDATPDVAADTAVVGADAQWKVWGGRAGFRWNTHLLGDLGLRLQEHDALGTSKRDDGLPEYALRDAPALDFGVNGGSFTGFTGGALALRGGVDLVAANGTASLRDMRLVARPGNPLVLDVVGSDGKAWLYVDRMMYVIDGDRTPVLSIKTMDLRIAPALAQLLGDDALIGLTVADMAMSTLVYSDKGDPSVFQPAQAKGSTKWPGDPVPGVAGAKYEADVFMHDFDVVYKRRRATTDGPGGADGGVVFAPSSTLRNNRSNGTVRVTVPSMTPRAEGGSMPASDPLGTSAALYASDVSWNGKFSPPRAPYNNDQHPFLVWNLFRIDASGRIDQIGRSGVKHAWLTTNSPCDVSSPGGQILGLGCADTYSDGNNDDLDDLGPRSELVPAKGLWGRCGSVYDVDCNGSRDTTLPALPCSGAECQSFSYRLEVNESDIDPQANPGATYFFESWYIVRDDINIFNTMQSRPVSFTWTSNIWNLNNGNNSALRLGPALDRWVSHATPGAGASSADIASDGGHARVAVRVVDLGAAGYRYDYAVMNLDFARETTTGAEPNLRVTSNDGFTAFSIPAAAALPIDAYEFRDADNNPANDWTQTREGNRVVWRAPAGNRLNWGSMYRFSITTAAPPVSAAATLTTAAATLEEIDADALVPQSTALVTYGVGGTLDGLAAGGEVSLRLNNGAPLVLTADGAFAFENEVLDGGAYAVTLLASPATQTCAIGNGSGTIAGADVTDVTVTCADLPPPTYSIGGTVSGLGQAQSMTLQLNGDETLVHTGSGAFEFVTLLADEAAYAVTVTQSPSGLVCSVANASGNVADADVTNVAVSCAPIPTYSIGGSVTGLAAGTSVGLRLNAGAVLTRNADGAFTFAQELVSGTAYEVTVATQPAGQRCVVANGEGEVGQADIVDVAVTCVPLSSFTIGGSVGGLPSGQSVALRLNGGSAMVISSNRAFTFGQALMDGSSYAVTLGSSPAGMECTLANATGTVDGGDVTDVTVTCARPEMNVYVDGFE